MDQRFHGLWSVEVVALDADFGQRFVITGSSNADSAYVATPGTMVDVAGDTWSLRLEWNDNAGSGWQPSDVRRTATYTITEGLAVTLGADDNLDAVRDRDYDDVVLVCRSKDPDVNPTWSDPPLSFTITEDQLRRPDDKEDRPDQRPDPPQQDRPDQRRDPRQAGGA